VTLGSAAGASTSRKGSLGEGVRGRHTSRICGSAVAEIWGNLNYGGDGKPVSNQDRTRTGRAGELDAGRGRARHGVRLHHQGRAVSRSAGRVVDNHNTGSTQHTWKKNSKMIYIVFMNKANNGFSFIPTSSTQVLEVINS
jgi:hypothetical protein